MKKALIISFTHLKNEPRVLRYIQFLKEDYHISAIGLNNPEIANVRFFQLNQRNLHLLLIIGLKCMLNSIKRYSASLKLRYNLNPLYKQLKQERFDLIIARGIETWPFATEIANGAKIILDAPEYFPKEFEEKIWWKLFMQDYYEYLCRNFLKQGDAVITVCDGIAEEYHKNFGIDAKVITNASQYHDLKPSEIDENHIKIIHHGAAISSRKIELMLEVMKYTDERFKLDLMLVPTHPLYLKYLKKKARKIKNIRFISPVPISSIIPKINNDYDMGLFLLPPTGFNSAYSLPNKFFEFIQARLALAIGPSEEMASLVKKYDCGLVSSDFSAKEMARLLNALSKEKIAYYKNQSNKAAQALTQEENKKRFKIIWENINNKSELL